MYYIEAKSNAAQKICKRPVVCNGYRGGYGDHERREICLVIARGGARRGRDDWRAMHRLSASIPFAHTIAHECILFSVYT